MTYFYSFFVVLASVVVFGSLLFILDDLFIDLYALVYRLKPKTLDAAVLEEIKSAPEKNIAILIANWKEADVIAPMIRGNLRGIQYANYTFFLGVYPNDTETWQAAKKLEDIYPHKVTVVVNSRPGPTSKGQMLNELVSKILVSEKLTGKTFDLFLMQDSEDVLHPYSLSLMNYTSNHADFVQIPVFSFNVPKTSFVSGIYVDEFAEAHTKDLLVRKHLGASVPSAGVGTLLARDLVLKLRELQDGDFLLEHTLTEDYHLGVTTKHLGFRSDFVCVQYLKDDGSKEFIATREYFPSDFSASMRQKSRWTLGIAFQGLENLGWKGAPVEKYFLWRDRRGPLNSILIVLSALLFVMFSLAGVFHEVPAFLTSGFFQGLFAITFVSAGLRIVQRMIAVSRTNAMAHMWLVPVRWLLANVINVGATVKAYNQLKASQKTGQRPQWIKTDHRLPEHFGRESEIHS